MYELLHKIQDISNSLTNTQNLVAKYVLTNYSKIPFITITNMALEIGVSDTTIINFCSMLGYHSFSSFKKVFIEYVQSELAIYENFESRMDNLSEDETISQVLNTDKSNIETTLTRSINRDNLVPFINMLDKASNIYVLGMRSSSILMDFLIQNLRVQGYNVIPLQFNGYLIDQLCQINKNDLFISFAFSRYTLQSIKALEFVSNNNVPCASFTDSILSPTYNLSNLTFICEIDSYTYQASYVGVLSLLNAILTETALRHKIRTRKHIDELEVAFEYFDTFTDNGNS